MKNITQEEWRSKLAADDNAYILDVRTQNEVDEGIIPDSHNIDIYEGQGFIDKVNKLDKSKKLLRLLPFWKPKWAGSSTDESIRF